MTEIKRKIEELVEPLLPPHGAFLVDAQVRNERGGKMVQVFVDTDAGIRVEQCSAISRDIARELDLHPVFDGSYRLEVSSPGIDRPLKILRQYQKNTGRRFKVKYAGDPEPKFLSATLVSVAGDRVTFQPDKGEVVTLLFSDIIESKEELPW